MPIGVFCPLPRHNFSAYPPTMQAENRSPGTSPPPSSMIHARKSQLEDDGSDEALLQRRLSEDEKPSSVLKSTIRWSTLDGRRLLFATCACLAAVSLFGLFSVMIWTSQSKDQVSDTLERDAQHASTGTHTQEKDKWSPEAVLLGPPTDSFRGMRSRMQALVIKC